MAFVPVNNTALVEVRMSYANQKVENTLWVESVDTWDEAALVELVSEVKDWWIASYSTIASDQVVLREVVATDMTTASSGIGAISGTDETGAQTGGGLPGNCSLACSFRTNSRGRAFRGRNYVVGIPILQMVDIDTVESAYALLVETAYGDFKTAISAADWNWVVVSRFSGIDPVTKKPIPRTAGITTTVTLASVVDRTIDSQRRRLTGRGQ